jgi:uncharacterized membrane protein YfcA
MDDPLLLAAAVLATSALSGVFGMGGGMILMGVYAALLPVREAMVLHGVTQLASNGFRAWLLRHHLHVPALTWYVPGAALGVAVFLAWSFVPDRALLFLVLGGLPLIAALLPSSVGLSIQSRPLAAACGFVVTAAQLVAGVSGPLLDVFFVRGTLDRYQVIGTKAVTQTLGHLLKLGYFGVLVAAPSELTVAPWAYPLVVASAVAGTRCGKALLTCFDDRRFRLASRALILLIAAVYVSRGLSITGS